MSKKFVPEGPPRYEHQKQALRKVISTRGVCALLLDPGLGKSAVVLDYMSLLALYSKEEEIRALMVSPKAAVDNWVLQAESYVHRDVAVRAEALGGSIRQKAEAIANRGPRRTVPRTLKSRRDKLAAAKGKLHEQRSELTYLRPAKNGSWTSKLTMLSVNYDSFSSRAKHGSGTMMDLMVRSVKAYDPHIIVLDESHKAKSVGSNTSRAMARIGKLTNRRLILTGTVSPHSPMDIFAQWRFLQPTAFGRYNPSKRGRDEARWTDFQKRFGEFGGFMGRQIVSFKNLDDMQEIMADNAVVVRKEDALDLPTMSQIEYRFRLGKHEQREYDSMRLLLKNKLTKGELGQIVEGQPMPGNALVQMMRLRQITAGHRPDEDGNIVSIGDTKVSVIESLVHDTLEGEDRIVIFALFRHEITELKKALKRDGTEIVTIDGSTSDKERLAIRQRFGSGDPARIVLVAQIKTISLSVNELVTASHAIFASLSQQRDDIVQAQDRLNRIGQTKPVTIWVPLATGTIDEVIWESYQKRSQLEASLLKHIMQIA